MSAGTTSIRDYLYEAPGPKTRRWNAVGTAVSLLALAALLYMVLRQFYITGQLGGKYWKLFTQYSTWRFLGQGLIGTLKAAATASVLVFLLGMLLMRGSSLGFPRIIRDKKTGNAFQQRLFYEPVPEGTGSCIGGDFLQPPFCFLLCAYRLYSADRSCVIVRVDS